MPQNLPNIPEEDGYNPLHIAAAAGRAGEIEAMRKSLPSALFMQWAQAKTKDGHTPLMLAAYNAQAEAVKELIPHSNLKALDNEMRSALQLAVGEMPPLVNRDGCGPVINELLQAGALKNPQNKITGDKLVHIAAKAHNHEAMAALLATDIPIDSCNNTGDTPLIIAFRSGDVRMAQMLCASKALTTKMNSIGESAVEAAIHSGCPKTVRYAVDVCSKAGVAIAADTTGSRGRSLLHHAIATGNVEMAEYVAGQGRQVGFASVGALRCALESGSREMLEYVKKRGGVMPERSILNEELSRAVYAQREEKIKLLLECGASPHAKTAFAGKSSHEAAAHLACSNAQEESTKASILLLLEKACEKPVPVGPSPSRSAPLPAKTEAQSHSNAEVDRLKREGVLVLSSIILSSLETYKAPPAHLRAKEVETPAIAV